MSGTGFDHDVVVVGSGFGGTMTALPLARAFKARGRGESVLVLERGTWWTTPVSTVQDKEVRTYRFLKDVHGQPVQLWSTAENFRGFIDLFTRCVRRKGNEDGLYDLTNFGRKGLLGLSENDGVTVLRASGVGGGSLVYANVTIRPPDEVLDDERWSLGWTAKEREEYFDLAREAIGRGVAYALYQREVARDPSKTLTKPPGAVNTGLSNIATRAPRLDPRFSERPDPLNARGTIKRIDLAHSREGDQDNALWIDRARVFQTAIAEARLTDDFGTVDSSINDITPEPSPFETKGHPKNFCERQGRCIIGCLPGARHTLNKQLMGAALGKPDGTPPAFEDLRVEALCEVDRIDALPAGGYRVHYVQRDAGNPSNAQTRSVTAARVVVAAGCVGTTEIMLRSRQRGGLPHLSRALGEGFSTNGDYLAFLDGTRERVSLTRGPVTTSFAHFGSPGSGADADVSAFHTIEDNGIPRAFSALTGQGLALLRSLSKGRRHRLFLVAAIVRHIAGRVPAYIKALLRNHGVRQAQFASEDEWTDNIMCVAAMGREQSVGRFRLGEGRRETTLRVARTDGKAFHEDPIYAHITASLRKLAAAMTDEPTGQFVNPFLTDTAGALGTRSIALSHPLGGCRTAASSATGVVDEFGRVFDTSRDGEPRPFYDGLYVADAARIPTALGVNPSLTISALALRTADQIIRELPAVPAQERAPTPAPVA